MERKASQLEYPHTAMSDQNNIPTQRTDFEAALSGTGLWVAKSFAENIVRELDTVTKERDDLATWKQTALSVELWWKEVEEYVRKMPEARPGYHVSHLALGFLKELGYLRAEVERLKDILHDCDTAPAQSEPSQPAGKECESCGGIGPWLPCGQFDAMCPNCGGKPVEPSQVGGKEHEDAEECPLCKQLADELAAAQATIAEQKEELRRTHAYAAERMAIKKAMEETDDWRGQCMQKDMVADQLRAENTALRAERDKAVKACEGWRSKWNEVQQRETKNYKRLVAERDSALAACAAKDVALRVAHECINQYSDEDQSGRMTHYYAESKLPIIAAALSPIAGSDYAPKAPMVELLRAGQALINVQEGNDEDSWKAEKRLVDALTATAPFLTDSTGEEGK